MLAITPDPEAPRTWRARQTLADPEGDHDWVIEAEADLDASDAVGGSSCAAPPCADSERPSPAGVYRPPGPLIASMGHNPRPRPQPGEDAASR